MHCSDNEYLQKAAELGDLLRESHIKRKKTRHILKERALHAECESQYLIRKVETLLLRLKKEQSKYHLLEASMEQLKDSQAASFRIREQQIIEKGRDLDLRTEVLSAKSEECENRLRSLNSKEKELLEREEQLRTKQAEFEGGIICARKQVEMEKLRSQRIREQADEIFEEARCTAETIMHQKIKHDFSYHFEKEFFNLEKEESFTRLCIFGEAIDFAQHLLTLRFGHIVEAEIKAFQDFRLRECDLLSRTDLLAMREKELVSRNQREQYRLNEEKEKIFAVKDYMRHECNLILEKVRLLGGDKIFDNEQSQLDRLRDLEKLFS